VQVGALVAGKYRILRQIGEGGMGSVWLAKNEVTERDFAIKFLHPSDHRSEGQLNRFFQEAKVAGKLRHPGIVEIFDAGTEPSMGDAPYLVMELLDGIGLDDAIQRAGALPLGTTLEIMAQVCRALSLAHKKGIIHRDLKPSNVFLHRDGSGALVPKVLDFGISKVLIDDATGKQVTAVTRTGAVLGSPLYMSPEQAAGDKSIDARSDVHSLGVMLWECLTGAAPFTADTYGLLLVEIIQGERPHLAQVLSSVPSGVALLVDRAIAKRRDERFADSSEVAEALEHEIHTLGFVQVLGTRTGAEAFFETVGSRAAGEAARATSTTAALEVPSRSDGEVVVARSEQRLVSGSEPRAPVAAAPLHASPAKKRGILLALALLGGGLAIGAAVVVGVGRSGAGPAASAAPELASAALPATRIAPEPSVLPSLGEPDPAVSPTASVSAPASSASPPLAVKTRPTPRPPPRPPAAPPAKPAKSADAVHHGVTSSGL
jgi:eukaryotic-like serine/threonine-protein kinase